MTAPPAPAARLKSAQLEVFCLLWAAYASYYLCRVNFAVAQPAILKEFPTWTSAQIGTIPSIYAAVYALGQIVNGTLSQRYGVRRLMTMALVVAGVTNLLFAFTSSFGSMRLLWAVNAFGQSAGWSLMVQVLANWNTAARRGTLIGRLSTCYAFGNVLSWLLAGYLCDALGWRAACDRGTPRSGSGYLWRGAGCKAKGASLLLPAYGLVARIAASSNAAISSV